MSAHTKEPWQVWTSNSHIRIGADGQDGNVVRATVAADGVPVLAIKLDDARRIVAAVNAVAGMPQDDLEELAKIEGGVMTMTVYADDMRQQRDQLLHELEAAHLIIRNALNLMTVEQKRAWGDCNAIDGVEGEGVTRANERAAVIAAVKGGAT